MNLKLLLIILTSIAVILGAISFYVVFLSGSGTYVVTNQLGGGSTSSTTDLLVLPTSTASSSLSSSVGSASPEGLSINYENPPITWMEGNESMAITGATLTSSQLILQLSVKMGPSTECVPMNMRIVTDENGDLSPPVNTQFAFPDTGGCQGTAGETYTGQQVIFTVDPSALPIVLTTGGSSNLLFEADVQSSTLTIHLPPQSD
jgi:hypothetical protein